MLWGWAGRGAGAGGLVVRAVMLGGSRGAQTKAESFPPHCWEEVEKQEETLNPGQAEAWCLWQGFQRSLKGCWDKGWSRWSSFPYPSRCWAPRGAGTWREGYRGQLGRCRFALQGLSQPWHRVLVPCGLPEVAVGRAARCQPGPILVRKGEEGGSPRAFRSPPPPSCTK